MNWIELREESDLNQILQSDSTIAIFKHSTRCSISSTAKNRIEREWNSDETPIYYLDIIRHRDLSNKIAVDLGVEHESPQLIVVQKGEVVIHKSHFAIIPKEISKHIQT